MNGAPRLVHFDLEAFRRRVDRLRAQHDARTATEAVAVSLEAFQRWGVVPPASFMKTTEAVAAGHRGIVPPPLKDDTHGDF